MKLIIILLFSFNSSIIYSQDSDTIRIVHWKYQEYNIPVAAIEKYLVINKKDTILYTRLIEDELGFEFENSISIQRNSRQNKKLISNLKKGYKKKSVFIDCEFGKLTLTVWEIVAETEVIQKNYAHFKIIKVERIREKYIRLDELKTATLLL